MEFVPVLLPALTLLDEAESASEVSIDPLGLYSIADALGVRLVPGVRERQRRPRFLTLLCASAAVCQDFEPDSVADDRISQPWQVFEWYVVEALVRRIDDNGRLRNLPGRDKVFSAVVQDHVPVSARRYLKTPSVFGFHGIYKVLARTLRVEHEGELDEHGYELLEIWESERALEGFWTSRGGNGRAWRDKLRDAVSDGLKRGCTSRSGGWEGWDFIATHLAHDAPGTEERTLIARLLMEGETGFRKDVLKCLVSPLGRKAWDPEESLNERPFHSVLASCGTADLKELLSAITAYEALARTLSDAFQACLYTLSQATQPISLEKFSKLIAVKDAKANTADQFRAAQDALAPLGLAPRLTMFAGLAAPMSTADWAEALMNHHNQVQRDKPPRGKAPWVIRYDDGRFVVRPQYRVSRFQPMPNCYVHQYRAQPLTTFARDLGLLQ
ncbi:MAG TPA: hypothetical protein VHU83_20645 [Bryobacteraceae bacterium]|nr:hypothetical protein [Bryobacteraceae bacterium]